MTSSGPCGPSSSDTASTSLWQVAGLAAAVGLAAIDGDGVIRQANPALAALFDHRGASLTGQPWAAVAPAAWVPLAAPSTATSRSGEHWLHLTAQPSPAGGGVVVVTVEDHTAVKALEERLSHRSRLSVLGELAAHLAHEISQPLDVIRLTAERQASDRETNGPAARVFRTILEQAERLRDIIHHVRLFAHQDADPPRPFDPVAVSRSAISLMAHRYRQLGVRLDSHLPRGGPLVLGHPVRFQQVVVNLLSNALDAVQDAHPQGGGRTELRFQQTTDGALLTVDDNGPGIPEALRPRVFEPFLTTKPAEKGTGLGLAICREILTAINGRIVLDDRPGPGARFAVWLPVLG